MPDEILLATLEHRLALLVAERARVVAKFDRRIKEARADVAANRPKPARKAPAKKTATKKTPAKKTPAKKTPVKKAPG